MNKVLTSLVVVALGLSAALALGQQTTERYIPIGQSPGLSAKSKTLVGRISTVEEGDYQMTVAHGNATTTVTMSEGTVYYLDRSGTRQTNLQGSFDDCEVGRRVEVHLKSDGTAYWVKIAN